jgi:hypothetical protein
MKQCLICGETENVTKDHVVPRLVLRMLLGREPYAKFCSEVRKDNIQWLCGPHNNEKGTRVIDYRDDDRHAALLAWLDKYGIEVEFEDPTKPLDAPRPVESRQSLRASG